ncbi:transcription elongation factor GreA [PVC group bacterium]|nr:transcription elongation factor GreA [PVC group bacterium]MCH7589535.1 transcription elongation factor GreA [PVC group bacterium]
MSDNIILSQDGYEKMKKELKHLKTVKRKEVIQAIKTARAHGDLRENAEYDAAKEEQGFVESRIQELEYKLISARIIDESQMSTDKVFIGAFVTIYDEEFEEEIKYAIVSPDEADLKNNKISVASAVGKALLGKKVGDIVDAKVPAGVVKYKILKIER